VVGRRGGGAKDLPHPLAQRRAAGDAERDVGPDATSDVAHLLDGEAEAEEPVQPAQYGRRVGGAPAEARAGGYVLAQRDPHRKLLPEAVAQEPPYQVSGVLLWRSDFGAGRVDQHLEAFACASHRHLVGERDALHDRPELVVPVGAPPDHVQGEVDLGVRLEPDGPPHSAHEIAR
jgi:hypothetical protein